MAGDREPPLLDYTKTPGLKQTIHNKRAPQQYFELFLMMMILNFLHNRPICMHNSSWDLLNWNHAVGFINGLIQIAQQFISLLMLMGLVHQLDIKEYWTTDPLTTTSFFSKRHAKGPVVVIDDFLASKWQFRICTTWKRGLWSSL